MPDPIFIDSGAVGLYVSPPDEKVLKYWSRFGKGVRHYLSHVVYWEYLRQFGARSNSLARQRFMSKFEAGGFQILPFETQQADIGVKIYQLVKSQLPDDKDGKLKLKDMHQDIMIAATAVFHHKTVITDDVKDWNLIKTVVENEKLGTLPLVGLKDMRGE
jgi:predicted nucleic acid-binding protein